MVTSRRAVLGSIAAGAVAGCLGGGNGDGGDGGGENGDGRTTTQSGLGGDGGPGSATDDSDETSPAGSCGSVYGDTLQAYDTGDRGMVATFSYPMGGDVTFEQSDDTGHLTSLGYGRGEISSLHSLVVGETGPLGGPDTAPGAYEYEEDTETATVTTYGGQTVPAHVRPRSDSVTYLVRVEGPDGTYELTAQAHAGEADPCPDVYDTIARQVIESFEPVA
jgi:hypothetical protein